MCRFLEGYRLWVGWWHREKRVLLLLLLLLRYSRRLWLRRTSTAVGLLMAGTSQCRYVRCSRVTRAPNIVVEFHLMRKLGWVGAMTAGNLRNRCAICTVECLLLCTFFLVLRTLRRCNNPKILTQC